MNMIQRLGNSFYVYFWNYMWVLESKPLEAMMTSFIPPHEFKKIVNKYCNMLKKSGQWMFFLVIWNWMKTHSLQMHEHEYTLSYGVLKELTNQKGLEMIVMENLSSKFANHEKRKLIGLVSSDIFSRCYELSENHFHLFHDCNVVKATQSLLSKEM